MSKIIKRFLCKYFSKDDNIVTIGSILELGFVYLIMLAGAILILYAFYASIYVYKLILTSCATCSSYDGVTFNLIMGEIGVIFEVILIGIGILKFISYISKIEVTRCEREE